MTSSILPWAQYTPETAEADPQLANIKNAIIAEYGQTALQTSWLKTCKALSSITAAIASKKTDAIPDLTFSSFCKLDETRKAALKEQGCFVIRDVIPRADASAWFDELKGFIDDNEGDILGWPAETPFMKRLYYTAPQMKARSHPNSLAVQRELNGWWSADEETSADPLTYVDACRVRPPGVPFEGWSFTCVYRGFRRNEGLRCLLVYRAWSSRRRWKPFQMGRCSIQKVLCQDLLRDARRA